MLRRCMIGVMVTSGLTSRCSLRKDILNLIDFKVFVQLLLFQCVSHSSTW